MPQLCESHVLNIGRYIFDRVLGMHTTQAEVFEVTALKLLEGVLNGYNATVFAYGVRAYWD